VLRLLPHRGRPVGPGGRTATSSARKLGRWREEIARVYEGRPSTRPASGCRSRSAAPDSRAPRWRRSSRGWRWTWTSTYETFDALYPTATAWLRGGARLHRRSSATRIHGRASSGEPGVALQITNISGTSSGRAHRAGLSPQADLRHRRERGGSGGGRYTPGFVQLMTFEATPAPTSTYQRAWRRCRGGLRAGSSRPRSWAPPLRVAARHRGAPLRCLRPPRDVSTPRLAIALRCWLGAG